ENIITRLEGVGRLIDQTIALMEQGMAAGLTPPQITLRDIPGQVGAQVVERPLDSPMLAAFKAFPSSIAESDRAMLTMRAVSAYQQAVSPAFKKLQTFLESRYLPACRTSTSVDALPTGAAMYAYNLQWHTTTGLTAQQIHALGQSEVKRIRAEMDQTMRSTGFSGSFAEFATFLRTSRQFYFADADS